ncbi:MAG: 2-hydroxyacyl-CoA dehydratase family protein [Verrucomicrobia bacterium]|nr:2-hydroxyacyl-CoA dehydratase family protein [Verrucomicrobiota bacterium]
MNARPARLSLDEWDGRYEELRRGGLREPSYGGPLRRHVADGDRRLLRLAFDNSLATLRLWNFLLTEEDRLHAARAEGFRIVGAMKDLGTVPVMAYSLPGLVAFYPDGAWWTPCVMEMSDELLNVADRLGIDETFCPVRAMLGAFVTRRHFPIPDLLVCSAGAVCDDFSAIAQRLNGLGHPILWWEIPHRRDPEPDEAWVPLPGGGRAPRDEVALVEGELRRVGEALGALAGTPLDEVRLAAGIRRANGVRRRLSALRETVFTAPTAPLPALELLIAEMLALHFCSDLAETEAVLDDLLAEAHRRAAAGLGVGPRDAVRVFWVNPVADLRMMNRLEQAGGRLCGTEFLFSHALDAIPEDVPPFEALARTAMADPMVGPARDRAAGITREAARLGAEAMVISRIPGASHCATEGRVIAEAVRKATGIPTVEMEVPPLSDALAASLGTRLEALVETARARRGSAT